jgi:hypothetical protein
MEIETRKVQITGGSTYVISLPKIWGKINFLIDTGSDITGISTNCYAMELSFNKLGMPAGSMSGLADKARRWEISRDELRAISADSGIGVLPLFSLIFKINLVIF